MNLKIFFLSLTLPGLIGCYAERKLESDSRIVYIDNYGDVYEHPVRTAVIEGCEYVILDEGFHSQMMSHKGNCPNHEK